MQGTQSNIIPDVKDGRGHLFAQRGSDAILAAMDDEEVGRPAWLRNWTIGEDRSTASAGHEVTPKEHFQEGDRVPANPVSAHAGQSIEAAFAYETIFHFDTEIEAESTEDWLDLSATFEGEEYVQVGFQPSSDGIATPQTAGARQSSSGARTEDGPASAAIVDPKAVRAAIFRLAQEPSARWQPGERQAEAAESALPATSSNNEVTPPAPPSSISQPGFAEIARQVWDAESSNVDVFDVRGLAGEPDNRITAIQAAAQPVPVEGDSLWFEEEYKSGAVVDERHVEEREVTPIDAEPFGSASTTPATKLDPPRESTATGAPALAHDAGNLLSALKLYSELFALSGVLQARHSHYAEDLKLLAARSEVLIHRLLQSFTLADHERRLLDTHKSEQTLHGSSDDAAAHDSNHDGIGPERIMSHATPLTEETANEETESHIAVPGVWAELSTSKTTGTLSQAARYWTEDRLNAIQEITEIGGKGTADPTQVCPGPALRPDEGAVSAVAVASSAPNGAENQSTQADEVIIPAEQGLGAGTARAADTQDLVAPLNFIELLTRWGSLLSMIARSPVQVNFGPNAALPVSIPEEALERILVNLVHNAMAATREGGSIRIGVGRAETHRRTAPGLTPRETDSSDRMVLTVDDSGCGMSEQQVARALGIDADAPSRRAPNETGSVAASGSRRRGHGIGLKIVRELVSSSGGELAIYSRLGAGTRIEIKWPVQKRRPDGEGLPERIPPASTTGLSPKSISQRSVRGFEPNQIAGSWEGAIAC